MSKASKSPIVLIIKDGWGKCLPGKGNAVSLARTPISDSLRKKYPYSFLSASGEDVGLPDGQMGNSEVGHLNLGAGRVVKQDLVRIEEAISIGNLAKNSALLGVEEYLQKKKKNLHFIGLLSEGGVHSHQRHLLALIHFFMERGIGNLFLHSFLDGRDSEIRQGAFCLEEVERQFPSLSIASVMGRYWGMDRGGYLERTEKAWRAIAKGKAEVFSGLASKIVQDFYERGESDEFIEPLVRENYKGFQEGDVVLCFNFRADRMRQLCDAFLMPENFDFAENFNLNLVTMTEYDKRYKNTLLFSPLKIDNCLGEIVSKSGLKQLRIAETEKYPHITYFFNGGVEKPFLNEERKIVPSPKVLTYDLAPEMSAREVGAECFSRLGDYDLVLVNFANSDMVGHTGDLKATIQAVEVVDEMVGVLVRQTLILRGDLLITADHGNCECMINKEGNPHTAHTTNLVECVCVSEKFKDLSLRDGILADVAPTLLDLLGVSIPSEMTGKSLLEK